MNARLHGLPPVVAPHTRVLVLGSFPGVRSLQCQQYYAHPQNQFWSLMQAIWPNAPWPADGDYAMRCACLLAQGVGLWDVYAHCEREGSLDSAIRDARLNDFAALLRQCPQLRGIAHNGAESFRQARVLVGALQLAGLHERVTLHALPSTSPANARWSWLRKLQVWQAMLQEHGLT